MDLQATIDRLTIERDDIDARNAAARNLPTLSRDVALCEAALNMRSGNERRSSPREDERARRISDRTAQRARDLEAMTERRQIALADAQ